MLCLTCIRKRFEKSLEKSGKSFRSCWNYFSKSFHNFSNPWKLFGKILDATGHLCQKSDNGISEKFEKSSEVVGTFL